jgi:YaiO family outer membrane protein
MKKSLLLRLLLNLVFTCSVLIITLPVNAQQQAGTQPDLDELFLQAQQLAHSQQALAARGVCMQILSYNQKYHDASILMARTHAWEQSYEQAKTILAEVLADDQQNISAIDAMADVQFWSGEYRQTIYYLDQALAIEPNNYQLMFKKAQALYYLEDYTPAIVLLNTIVEQDPTLQDARDLLAIIMEQRMRNQIGAGYRIDFFDNQDPWHLAYLEYGRRFQGFGTAIARVNHARRFDNTGLQFEVDAYPNLAPGSYLYLNAGYSPDHDLFPQYKAAAELFHRLPTDFEASVGFRILTFADNDLLIATGSISKYYQRYYFSFRPYFNFTSVGPNSQSYFVTARRYFSSPLHHLSLILGTGFSADQDALLGAEIYNLSSNTILLQYQQNITNSFLIKAGAGFQHYSQGIWGNKYSFELGLVYLF